MLGSRSLLAVVALVAATLLGGVTAAPAFAHTSLIGAEPADGSTVEALPDTVSLAFSDTIQEPAFVVVTAPDGTELQRGDAVVEGMYVRQRVRATGARGTHTVTYRVVSADGHPVQGQITTQVGPDGSDDAEPTSAPSASPTESDASQDTEPSSDPTGPPYLLIISGLLVVLGAVVARTVVKRRQP